MGNEEVEIIQGNSQCIRKKFTTALIADCQPRWGNKKQTNMRARHAGLTRNKHASQTRWDTNPYINLISSLDTPGILNPRHASRLNDHITELKSCIPRRCTNKRF